MILKSREGQFLWVAATMLASLIGASEIDAQSKQRPATPDPYFSEGSSKPAADRQQLTPQFSPLKIPGRSRTPQSSLSNPMATDHIHDSKVGKTSHRTPVSPRETFTPGQVLALVGGEPIFVGDLMFEANQLVEQHMATAPPQIKKRQRDELIPKLLPKFVEAKLLFKGATRKLPPELDLENVINEASKQFDEKALPEMMESSGVNSVAEFDAQLRGQGSSLRKLKRSWSIDQLTKLLVGQQLSQVPEVTHREMLEEYQKELSKYEFPAKAKWEQIMIRFDRAGSRSSARKKAEELTEKIVNGANLAALAKKESHGFRKSEGGQYDWTTKGALVAKEVDEALFSLPIGTLSDILESESGFHIVRVIERTEAGRTSFRDAQVEIKKNLIEARRKKAFADFMDECRQDIPVEYPDN